MVPQWGTLKLLIFMIFCHITPMISASYLGTETDQLALLQLKSLMANSKTLSSWNDSIPHCQWPGVTCGHTHHRVTGLDLGEHNLVGPISPHIGNLSFLKNIDFGTNRLNGNIPQEIGRLYRLRYINLTANTLGGAVPMNLSYCTELEILDLSKNEFKGELPMALGSLKKLVILRLYTNNFTGEIPNSFGNLSSLEQISLSFNNLQGSIPNELSRLTKLSRFASSANILSEYGTGGEISTHGDVYSYGIVLLEMITGKRPTSDIFKEGLDLHNYVKNALPIHVWQIADPLLIRDQKEESKSSEEIVEMGKHGRSRRSSHEEEENIEKCIISILNVGLACSEESPRQRMNMNDVIRELQRVKTAILNCGRIGK